MAAALVTRPRWVCKGRGVSPGSQPGYVPLLGWQLVGLTGIQGGGGHPTPPHPSRLLVRFLSPTLGTRLTRKKVKVCYESDLIWVKYFKRFLGESHTFSQVLFIVFMDTCWFSGSDLHTCFGMQTHYIPEIQTLHWRNWSTWVCTLAKFYCLAMFQGDEVYM